MKLIERLTQRSVQDFPLSLQQYVNQFQFGGIPYAVTQSGGTPGENVEKIEANFRGYVEGAYKRNGVVFACMAARMLLFSEARFQFQQMRRGRPGDLFGTADLGILENPWPNGTTGDLLKRVITDADLAGNSYTARWDGFLRRLRPDWVDIIVGSRSGSDLDADPVGYLYTPGGPASGEAPIVLMPDQVAHFAPYPDPVAKFRGMSWISAVTEEVTADAATTLHKRNFFEHGAKLGYVVTLGKDDPTFSTEKFDRWIARFRVGHEGALNAYKTLFLAGGADIKTVGADLQQADFKQVQGAGETRICAAARVPPIIVGVSEGLDSATYSNYGQARRAFADLTMRPMWRDLAGCFQSIIDVPAASRLWYDGRDIAFLQEDEQDAASIQQTQSVTVRELINAGFEPASVVAAVMAQDFGLLEHSGLVSVQLQPPGTSPDGASLNGNGQPSLPTSTS